MPPENVFTSRSAASARSSRSSSSSARRRAIAFGRWCSRPTISRLARALSNPSTVACWAATPMRSRTAAASVDDVESGHGRPSPSVGRRQRGEDADGGGLAGAVVAEQAEHRAGSDVEVEVAQGPQVAEALAEAGGDDAAVRLAAPLRHACSYGVPIRSYIVRRTLAVHCTRWQQAIRASAAAPSATASGLHASEAIRQYVVDKVTEKVNAEGRASRRTRSTPRRSAKQRIDRLAAGTIDALDLWTRAEPGTVGPLHPRGDRRDRGAHRRRRGLRRAVDAPPGRRARRRDDDAVPLRPHQGRAAHAGHRRGHGRGRAPDRRADSRRLARRDDRDRRRARGLRLRAPPVDLRHRRRPADRPEQRAPLRPVAAGRRRRCDDSLADKLDIISVVDEYVFGYCLHAAQQLHGPTASSQRTTLPCSATCRSSSRPATTRSLRRSSQEHGLEPLWTTVSEHDSRRDSLRPQPRPPARRHRPRSQSLRNEHRHALSCA